MKKLLCMLLVLVMVLSLAACADSGFGTDSGKDRDEEEEKVVELKDTIVGTWSVEINFTEEMLDMHGLHMDGIPMEFTFTEDGKCTLGYAENAHEIIKEQLREAIIEQLYTELEAEGYNRSEIDEICQTYTGMSVVEYAESEVDAIGIQDRFTVEEKYVEYQVDDDKLTIEGTVMTAEIKGSKLTITTCSDDIWETVGLELPVVLERVD